jgi:hypothetical protein
MIIKNKRQIISVLMAIMIVMLAHDFYKNYICSIFYSCKKNNTEQFYDLNKITKNYGPPAVYNSLFAKKTYNSIIENRELLIISLSSAYLKENIDDNELYIKKYYPHINFNKDTILKHAQDISKETYYGLELSIEEKDRYMQAGITTIDDKDNAACIIFTPSRIMQKNYDTRSPGPFIDPDETAYIHEVMHCVFMASVNRYEEFNQSFKGLELYTFKAMKLIDDKDEFKIRKMHKEHILESYADVATLMHIYFDLQTDKKSFKAAASQLTSLRNIDKGNLNEHNIGHYTYPYISRIDEDYRNLEDYRIDYKNDPVKTVMDYLAKYGDNFIFKYVDFKKAVSN